MSKFCRSLLEVCWGLGLFLTLGGVVLRLLPALAKSVTVSTRGVLMLAAVLFLCALATGEVRRGLTSS